MLTHALVIARKELTDARRDVRPLVSSLFYCLMGPGIVFMVSLTLNAKADTDRSVLIGMMSVFVLVSAFSGGMNVAMDVLAGERERQSLLPLLMNGVARRDVVLGKWMAISCFSAGGVLLDLAAFVLALGRAGFPRPGAIASSLLLCAVGLAPLALFASAAELALSTVCRTIKEAHTYLSMMVFLPVGLGMFAVFFPKVAAGWGRLVPLLGQQWQVELWWRGDGIPVAPALIAGAATTALAGLAVYLSARLLRRDDVVYGG